MITIVDYGMGNMGSIENMLRRSGHASQVSSDPTVIRSAERIILPGVGSFDSGMRCINESGLRGVLDELYHNGRTPILGICLGMQLLFDGSEEGDSSGLGWLTGRFLRITQSDDQPSLRVPHMGWNIVKPVSEAMDMFADLGDQPRYYFVHSYSLPRDSCKPEYVAGVTQYGREFVSAVRFNHLWGAQFHPEKSHRYGIQLLHNFATCTFRNESLV